MSEPAALALVHAGVLRSLRPPILRFTVGVGFLLSWLIGHLSVTRMITRSYACSVAGCVARLCTDYEANFYHRIRTGMLAYHSIFTWGRSTALALRYLSLENSPRMVRKAFTFRLSMLVLGSRRGGGQPNSSNADVLPIGSTQELAPSYTIPAILLRESVEVAHFHFVQVFTLGE
jgi:hypothetical protein